MTASTHRDGGRALIVVGGEPRCGGSPELLSRILPMRPDGDHAPLVEPEGAASRGRPLPLGRRPGTSPRAR